MDGRLQARFLVVVSILAVVPRLFLLSGGCCGCFGVMAVLGVFGGSGGGSAVFATTLVSLNRPAWPQQYRVSYFYDKHRCPLGGQEVIVSLPSVLFQFTTSSRRTRSCVGGGSSRDGLHGVPARLPPPDYSASGRDYRLDQGRPVVQWRLAQPGEQLCG